jgi:hypothetical protein
MVTQIKTSLSSTRIFLNAFASPVCTRMAFFFTLFLVFELSTMVEGKSLGKSAYKNGTIVSKGGRYLTLDPAQGITGEYSNTPNGRNILRFISVEI